MKFPGVNMKKVHIVVYIFLILITVAVHGDIEVISSACKKRENNLIFWLRCPEESGQFPGNMAELQNDMISRDEDQKFCCGPVDERYCCDLNQKKLEDPRFDPGKYKTDQDQIIEIRVYSFWSAFWWSILWLSMTMATLYLVIYVFGGLIIGLLQLLCCCSKKDYNDVDLESSSNAPGDSRLRINNPPRPYRNDLYEPNDVTIIRDDPPKYSTVA